MGLCCDICPPPPSLILFKKHDNLTICSGKSTLTGITIFYGFIARNKTEQ